MDCLLPGVKDPVFSILNQTPKSQALAQSLSATLLNHELIVLETTSLDAD